MMFPCFICGKDTQSHEIYRTIYVCHTCFTEKSDKVEELRAEVEKEENARKRRKFNEVLKNVMDRNEKLEAREEFIEEIFGDEE